MALLSDTKIMIYNMFTQNSVQEITCPFAATGLFRFPQPKTTQGTFIQVLVRNKNALHGLGCVSPMEQINRLMQMDHLDEALGMAQMYFRQDPCLKNIQLSIAFRHLRAFRLDEAHMIFKQVQLHAKYIMKLKSPGNPIFILEQQDLTDMEKWECPNSFEELGKCSPLLHYIYKVLSKYAHCLT
jgi:hypothetical protein